MCSSTYIYINICKEKERKIYILFELILSITKLTKNFPGYNES